MKKNIIYISTYLVYLLPLALLTGSFLPDLLVCVIAVLTTFLIVNEKKYKYFNNYYFYIFIIFCIYLIVRSLFAKSIIVSLESSLFYFRFGLFAIGVWYLLDNNNKLIKNFSTFLCLTFIFALIDGYYQFFNEKSIFGFNYPGTRLSLSLNDKAILGGYLARLFPLLLAVFIYSFDLKKSYLFFVLLILILTDVLIFISGERTALGLLFLSTVFIIIFLSKYKKIRLFTFLFSILIMTLLATFNPGVKQRNIDHTINQLSEGGSINLFSKRHEAHIKGAWNMFIDNPLVGQGPKMFRLLCNDIRFNQKKDPNTCSTHPHNSYSQLLAETGLIGISFIILICFQILKLIFQHTYYYFRRHEFLLSDFEICLIACVIVTLWPFVPSQNFFNNWINVIYFLPIGFLLHSFGKKDHEIFKLS